MKYSEQPLKLCIKRDTLKIYNKWNDILKHVCEYETRKNTPTWSRNLKNREYTVDNQEK